MSRFFRFLSALALICLPFISHTQIYNGPESVAFDYEGNRYFISNCLMGNIIELDTTYTGSPWVSGLSFPIGNCILENTFYVSADSLIGFDLTTGDVVFSMVIPAVNSIDGLAADSTGHLYVVDTGGRLYKVYLEDETYTTFVSAGLAGALQDIIYDHFNNRLLAVGYVSNSPVQAIDLQDSMVTVVAQPPIGSFDGITIDQYGNVYLSSHAQGGKILMYDNQFENEPLEISTGHLEPAGLDYNRRDNVLAIPNFGSNTVDFIDIIGMNLSIEVASLTDNGNGDGRADPGETCELVITIHNHEYGPLTTTVMGFISTDDPAVDVVNNNATYADLEPGASASNASDPYIFTVSETDPRFAEFMMVVMFDGTYRDFTFEIELGRPLILLVDDDGGDDHETFYLDTFEELDLFVDVWDETGVVISPEELSRYGLVIWETGDTRETLSEGEQLSIQGFLNNDGDLLFTSTNAGAELNGTAFYSEYLHAEFIGDTIAGAVKAYGVDGCPFSSSNDSLFFVGGSGAGNYTSLDAIAPMEDASEAYVYNDAARTTAGIYYNGGYKLIYLAFPFETVTGLASTLSRDQILANMFEWYDFVAVKNAAQHILPAETILLGNYPNPFNPTSVIGYKVSIPGRVNLSVYDLAGRRIADLVAGWHSSGYHEANFDGSDLSSGIYLYILTSGEFADSGKMVLLK